MSPRFVSSETREPGLGELSLYMCLYSYQWVWFNDLILIWLPLWDHVLKYSHILRYCLRFSVWILGSKIQSITLSIWRWRVLDSVHWSCPFLYWLHLGCSGGTKRDGTGVTRSCWLIIPARTLHRGGVPVGPYHFTWYQECLGFGSQGHRECYGLVCEGGYWASFPICTKTMVANSRRDYVV